MGCRRAHPQKRDCLCCSYRVWNPCGFLQCQVAPELSSGRGSGLHVHEPPASQRLISAKDGSRCTRDRGTTGQDSRRRIDGKRCRVQPAESHAVELQRVLLRDAEGMEGSSEAGRAVSVYSAEREPKTRRSSAGHCVLILSSSHPGCKNLWRGHVRARGPGG